MNRFSKILPMVFLLPVFACQSKQSGQESMAKQNPSGSREGPLNTATGTDTGFDNGDILAIELVSMRAGDRIDPGFLGFGNKTNEFAISVQFCEKSKEILPLDRLVDDCINIRVKDEDHVAEDISRTPEGYSGYTISPYKMDQSTFDQAELDPVHYFNQDWIDKVDHLKKLVIDRNNILLEVQAKNDAIIEFNQFVEYLTETYGDINNAPADQIQWVIDQQPIINHHVIGRDDLLNVQLPRVEAEINALEMNQNYAGENYSLAASIDKKSKLIYISGRYLNMISANKFDGEARKHYFKIYFYDDNLAQSAGEVLWFQKPGNALDMVKVEFRNMRLTPQLHELHDPNGGTSARAVVATWVERDL